MQQYDTMFNVYSRELKQIDGREERHAPPLEFGPCQNSMCKL